MTQEVIPQDQSEENRICFIRLTGKHGAGKVAIIDLADAMELGKHDWHLGSKNGYAARSICRNGKRSIQHLHKAICPTNNGMRTDHINRNKLDNRRSNLRPATSRLNAQNATREGKTSQYTGVIYSGEADRWQASIYVEQRRIYLGRYSEEENAARAYDSAVYHFEGDGAMRNFPNETPHPYPYPRSRNKPRPRASTTGVYYDTRVFRAKPYKATVWCPIRRKQIYIDSFSTEQEAITAVSIGNAIMAVAELNWDNQRPRAKQKRE